MRTRAYIEGAVLGYMYQAAALLTGLWLTPFLLHRLGQSDYGHWLVCLQVLNYIMLADFGTVALLPRDVAYASGTPDPARELQLLTDVLSRAVQVVLVQTLLLLVLAALTYAFVPIAVPPDFRRPLVLLIGGFIGLFPLRIFSAALEGLQDLNFVGKMRIVTWAVSIAATFICVLLNFGIYALALSWILNQIGFAVGTYFRLRFLRPALVESSLFHWTRQLQWHDLFRGSWMTVEQIAQLLINSTDLMIVGRVFGPASVVAYSCTGKLMSVLANQPYILVHAALPGLSQMKANEPREKLLRVSTALGQAMLIAGGAIGILVLCLNEPFVRLWVGSRFFVGRSLTLILVATTVARQLMFGFEVALFAFGYQKSLAIKSLANGLLGTGLALILSHWMGVEGVALGFLAGELLIGVPVNLLLLARECHVSALVIAVSYWPWFWRFAIVASISWYLSTGSWVNARLRMAVVGTSILVTYLAAILTFVRTSEMWPYISVAVADFRKLIGRKATAKIA
jgi:O-antigen/teichoic acid export membrane protein